MSSSICKSLRRRALGPPKSSPSKMLPLLLPPQLPAEGDFCLRSSDCAAGLCCARHFWSKICKPVLQEGQVCTKHRRKGSHGLEIFQRCHCAEGLACRLQRDHGASNSSRLHTCQRH
uniref:Dickkopf WNT signaling pathway inhibitor 1 n=1 Tax=Apteryx owenii TaxID=8824 RepID=A0A8B9PDH0_APTOW